MLDEQYRNLFAIIARNGAINGENALEMAKNEGQNKISENSIASTEVMIENFRKLEDKISLGKEPLTGLDYVFLYVGAIVSKELITKSIEKMRFVVNEYENNILPALKTVAQMSDEDDKDRDTMIIELIGERMNEILEK